MARRGTSEDRFWRAIEIAAYGMLDKDIADVGRYVASRGPAAVAEFEAELDRTVVALRHAGVADSLQRAKTTTPDGRAFADLPDLEVDHGLASLLLAGKRYFEILLKDPEREGSGPGSLALVDFHQAVETAREEAGIETAPLWQEMPGDRRRDGNLWIELSQATGVGVPGWNSAPWTVRGLPERFRKAAVLRSLDDSWREWRSSIGARALDVWVEYWLPESEPERVAVTKRGRKTAVVVYRDFPRLLAPGDPIEIAEREADAVFDAIRSALP